MSVFGSGEKEIAWDKIIRGTGDQTHALQAALNSDTTILVKRSCTIHDVLTISAETLLKVYPTATITQDESLDDNLVENLNVGTNDRPLIIDGGHWDGNGGAGGRSTGDIFHIVEATAAASTIPHHVFKNMYIRNSYNRCFSLQGGGNGAEYIFSKCAMRNPVANVNACYLEHVNDIKMSGCMPIDGLQAHGVISLDLEHFYLNAQSTRNCLLLEDYSRYCTFKGGFMDLDTATGYAVSATDCKYATWSDFYMRIVGDGAAVDYAILLGGDSQYNLFCNVGGGRGVGAGTRRFDTIIRETGATDGPNQFVNINGADAVTQALYLKNATSKNQHQNIIGTVTEA